MRTFRVRAGNCSISIIVDARSPEEATVHGALFLLVHRLVDNLDQGISATPWYASLEDGEYVPREDFAALAADLARLMVAAGTLTTVSTLDRVSQTAGSCASQPVADARLRSSLGPTERAIR